MRIPLVRLVSAVVPLALLGLVVTSVGCPGSLDDIESFRAVANDEPDAAPDVTVPEPTVDASPDVTTVDVDPGPCLDTETGLFPTYCGACHGMVDPDGKLDLLSPDVRQRLTGAQADGDRDLLLIDPISPESSVLYTKLLVPTPFGAVMPPGAPFHPTWTACVLDWIRTAPDAGPDAAPDATDDAGDDAGDGG